MTTLLLFLRGFPITQAYMLSYMVHNGYMYVAGELPKIKSMLAVIQCTVPMHAFKHATVVKCQ